MRITFTNTAGAPVSGQPLVTDFPALVRLSKENFPFSTADVGSDLRFVDENGTNLAYEIEDWNPSTRLAAIWVRLPLLDPHAPIVEGEQRNPITMYWGNPGAINLSSGPAVFSAFTAVLHLTPSWDGWDHRVTDSSGHGNDGVPLSEWADAWIAGQAGQALDINDQEPLATPVPVPSPGEFTLSVWFKTTAKRGGGLIGFADTRSSVSNDTSSGPARLMDRVLWMADRRLHFAVLDVDRGYSVISSPPLNQFDVGYSDGRWHVVVARLSAEGQDLFADGDLLDSAVTTPKPVSYNGYWRVGTSDVVNWPAGSGIPAASSAQFPGVIDEVRVYPAALSNERIAADYQIQREDTRWVKTERLDKP